ncbi:MAG: hypothetical protein ABI743_08870, partial [bacterium]
MKPGDFAVDPSYLIGADLLQILALVLGGLSLILVLRAFLLNGRPGWHLTKFTFLDILRTRLYWVIVGCAIATSVGAVLIMFLKAYPEMKDSGVSGVELVAGLYMFSDSPQNIPTPDDPAAAARDLQE